MGVCSQSITVPVSCSFLLLTLLCSSLGLLNEFQSFSINLLQLSMGSPCVPLRHVFCQGLQCGCLLHHGLSRVYREVPAPPGPLQGHRAISAWDGPCLAWGSPSLSSQRSPLQLPSPPAPGHLYPVHRLTFFCFKISLSSG